MTTSTSILAPAAFSPKDSAEIIMLGFDFAALLAEGVTISGPATAISVHDGTDASAASVLSGAPTVSGTKVLQQVVGGVAGVTYKVRAQADASDGQRYVLAGLLPVRAA